VNLVGKCRTNGYYPVISSVYPRGDYTADNYAKLKHAHLVINTWDVPSLNLLTPVDDGTGRWISGLLGGRRPSQRRGYTRNSTMRLCPACSTPWRRGGQIARRWAPPPTSRA
jgi:hypothetical protein